MHEGLVARVVYMRLDPGTGCAVVGLLVERSFLFGFVFPLHQIRVY